jgi:PhzF family phenazine biosynthesis protein
MHASWGIWMREDHEEDIPFYQVDAFTNELFRGNPAAVCLLERPCEDDVLQSIAAEMNLSETAFLRCTAKKTFTDSHRFSLRWFTPRTEVPLCGHATLATAAVLFYDVGVSASEIAFETKSGELAAKKEENGILLDFPSDDVVSLEPNREILSAIGVRDFERTYISKRTRSLLIHLRDERSLVHLQPDFERMTSIQTRENIKGVIVTSKGHPPYDFVSRFFAPWVGINEDPVTGAAHTVLGPYWSNILQKKEMLAYQASSRGGELGVRIPSQDRVELVGNAVIVLKGRLYLS